MARDVKIVRDGAGGPIIIKVRKQRRYRKKLERRLYTPRKERGQQWKRSLKRNVKPS